jgi:MoxR-like ATPase
MFQSVDDLSQKLSETGYFIDPTMTKVVFLADQMKKPLLLEGPAGSGKTQLAISVAAAAGTHVERLQCYRGVSEEQAIGRFDESCSGSTWSTPRDSMRIGRTCRPA